MTNITFDITVSLDGYVAGPNQSRENPLGEGGEQLHEWALRLASWRESHGRAGGEAGPDSDVLEETVASNGAIVMGRGMFGGGPGPWATGDDEWRGWWGEETPFDVPVFVLTHHEREPLVTGDGTTFTFVTDGIESALERAKAGAGERNVQISGGAQAIQQYLAAGLVDEFQVHVVPLFLGAGERLFDDLGGTLPTIELIRTVASPTVTHLRYRVLR